MVYLKVAVLIFFVSLSVYADDDSEVKGCESDGKQYKVGEQRQVPEECSGQFCKENNEWAVVACGSIGVPYKWVTIPEDKTKPYPECCATAVPPENIVPDLLDKVPSTEFLDIEYEGAIKVDVGNELTPTQVKAVPSVHYAAENDSFYLLYMTDPDAPSRAEPTSREFRHWLVANIPGNNVQDGEVLSEYVGSGPPKGTGLHRYVFLLYKQPGKLSFEEPKESKSSIQTRVKTSVRKFAEKYNLRNPLGVNLYLAQYDDYVPQLHKEIGLKTD